MSACNEFEWIRSLSSNVKNELKLGIGDDAAVFQGSSPWCISTDSLVENSHFLPEDSPEVIAQKLVRVNLSDMAAMGCQPKFFLLNLHMNASWSKAKLEAFKSGLLSELKQWNVELIGGDTVSAKSGPLHLVGTILGQPFHQNPITRSGAKVGDLIYVTGALGGSFPKRHLQFTPRLEWSEMLCLHAYPNAMMDISDGLLQDLGHILDQSQVAARLNLDDVPIHDDLTEHPEALSKALSDGEDFELLFTLPPERAQQIPPQVNAHPIGVITEGQGEIFARESKSEPYRAWPRLGFEHNTNSPPIS